MGGATLCSSVRSARKPVQESNPSPPPPPATRAQPRVGALGGNWVCEVGADLATAIRANAAGSKSEGYAAKAANAIAKLNDFLGGRWAASPWWAMNEGTRLPSLAAPCPILQW